MRLARVWLLMGTVLMARHASGLVLGTEGPAFTIDGRPTFLLGISYYGGLGAPEELLIRDLDEIQRRGFNWVRVWATWTAFENDVSAVEDDGSPREPYLTRLQRLVELADERGIIVDVTLTRGMKYRAGESRLWGKIPTFEAHLTAVKTIARALKPYRNLYIDLANERNIRDDRFVSYEELRTLRDAVKEIDPARLVTASHAGDLSPEDLRADLDRVRVDLITPHRPRRAGSPMETMDRTPAYLAAMEETGRVVPLHYQEPFRRDFNPKRWNPLADDFMTDLRNAQEKGAAGWCLHNGDNRGSADRRPRRSFDLRDGSLFDQLDDEENAFLRRLEDSRTAHSDDG